MQEHETSTAADGEVVEIRQRYRQRHGERLGNDDNNDERNATENLIHRPILRDIEVIPYLQRNSTEKSTDERIYTLYLAMHEPQKRLHIYKVVLATIICMLFHSLKYMQNTTQRLLSVCDGYGRISLDFSREEERSEDNVQARM